MMRIDQAKPEALVIGAGPAGLMAAEQLARAGARVTLCEAMPSLARKFLMAGVGGLNITHAEPFDLFLTRYGARAPQFDAALRAFPPDALRAFCAELGQETFVGSSGRVFPVAMKASPLLRAWLARLGALGVNARTRLRFEGWENGACVLRAADGLRETLKVQETLKSNVVVLALGGASWPRLGSTGGWVDLLLAQGVGVAALQPANCGLLID